jgi:type IV pilus assembly protein PilY1
MCTQLDFSMLWHVSGVGQKKDRLNAGHSDARRGFSESAKMLRLGLVVLVLVLVGGSPFRAAIAQTTVNLAQVPLLALKSAPGLVMLTMSRDHRLFYAAYNDTSDIDGDGVVDVGFKPGITYYGNFVSDRCYDYVTSGTNSPLYRPVAMATSSGCKSGTTQRWHGNWLNWAATSRMDALRRVLYGGYRVVDNATTSGTTFTSTVLQAAFIPKDSHVWGKEFRPGRDVYDITQYTALPTPSTNKQHLFVVVKDGSNLTYPFMSSTNAPVLRYITDADKSTERIWTWASADVAQGIGTNPANFSKGGGRNPVSATDRTLRVEACVPIGGVREAGCKGYPVASPVVWKPTGTLHDYAANDQLKFGLITGSYAKNYSGGVLRRNIASFNDEIEPLTGQFKSTNDGIARTIDRITIHGWNGSSYDCGYKTTANRDEGECKSWGAPVGEMMYEGLRYFSGKGAGTTAYGYSSGSADTVIGFSALPAWQNPFREKSSGGSPICSRAVQMVIADPLTSFDSDQLPGAYFSPTTNFGAALGGGDLTGLNVTTQANDIWTLEGLGTRNIYIGQSGTVFDGNPTAKFASSFAQIRGHAPDETQSQGSFYSAAVARFGRSTGVPVGAPSGSPAVPTVAGQKVDTIAVALVSLTPKIEFTNPLGGKVSIVPLSKAVGNAGINKTPGAYQATGAISGFYYADYTPSSVSAVVNFSDADQGTDNETDAQVQYDISISGTNLTVKMTQLDKNPGGIQSNLGYVISGTTKDGLYLETRTNTNGTPSPISAGDAYYLDTLAGQDPAPALPSVRMNGTACPSYDPANPPDPTQPTGNSSSNINARAANAAALAAINACLPSWDKPTTRTFTLSNTASVAGAFLPHDPLWYAAKYGGAGVLDSKGDPTNYFKISNPSTLPDQMGKAFRSAAALAAVASTSVVGVGQRSAGSAAIYQANYDSLTWSSRLYAFPLAPSGTLSNTAIWEASSLIKNPALRAKLFLGRGGTNAPFALTSAGFSALTSTATPTAANPNPEQIDFGSAAIYAYLLGDKSGEERKGGSFRNRGTTAGSEFGSVLGDIVNSDPQIISKKDYGYAASDTNYSTFLAGINFETLAVGSNDGFFHVFDAQPDSTGGGELLGFMPQAARTNIKDLSAPGYQHRNFVDGAIGLGHAKIAVPGDAASSWRSIAVAAGGDGAQTVFAVNTSSKIYTANSILWEINQSSAGIGATLGNVMGRPSIGKLANGTWVAIFGNGYNSAAGTANLYVVRLTDGLILKIIPTNNVMTGNGLSSTELVRKTSGSQDTIEFVYGADYKGHIWRFNLSDSNMSNWSASGALIYSTPTGRPITAEIKVGPAPASPNTAGGMMVYFGTGSYLSATDPATTTVQALYGIYDDLLHTPNTSPFALDTNLSLMRISTTAGSDVRTTSSAALLSWFTVAGKKGWIVELTGANVVAGERVIAPPVRYTVAGLLDAFLFTSIVPSTDDCEAGLDAWITGIDAMTGGYRKVFNSIDGNSVRIRGGSPRGVFVLQDGGAPTLYISQTVFNGTISTTSFVTGTGGSQSVTINGVDGTTRVISIGLINPVVPAMPNRQVWRQLK